MLFVIAIAKHTIMLNQINNICADDDDDNNFMWDIDTDSTVCLERTAEIIIIVCLIFDDVFCSKHWIENVDDRNDAIDD